MGPESVASMAVRAESHVCWLGHPVYFLPAEGVVGARTWLK